MRRHLKLRTEPPRAPEGFILPCLPTFAHELPEGAAWIYEIKVDGYRFQCRRAGKRLHVYSRWGVDWAAHVPGIVETLSALPVRSLTIDGEGVACGANGVPDFDLRWEPWETRRTLLLELLRGAGVASGCRIT